MAQSKLKIITRAVFQMTADGYQLIEEDSYEHAGPVALAKSGGRPPASPDYIGAANAQGQQNLNAIRTGAALNRVNQVTPYGSVTYSRGGGGGSQQPQTITNGGVPVYGIPGAGGGANPAPTGPTGPKGGPRVQSGPFPPELLELMRGAQQHPAPSGGDQYDTSQDQWTQTTQLSPEQQRIFNQGQTNQIDLGRIAGLRLGQVGNAGDFNLNGLPSQVNGVEQGPLNGDVGLPGAEQRTRAEDAIYNSAKRQLEPQFDQRENATRSRLINSGVREGSEAWNTELGNLGRERESAYGDARDRSIVGGGAEASRMLQDDLSRTGFANQTEGQRFAQALQNAGLQNQGRSAGVNERLTERQVPLNEFMSLFGGGGGGGSPLNPPGVPSAGTPAPGDLQGAMGQQYGASVDQYNARQQQNAQNTNSLLALASIFAMSDRRMKRDIERHGELPNGLPTYRYRYTFDNTLRVGVMADEVEPRFPHAVREIDGYKHVDYDAIGARHLLEERP